MDVGEYIYVNNIHRAHPEGAQAEDGGKPC